MIKNKEFIEINEIIEICADFINNPDDKEKADAFIGLKQSLQIRTYVPLQGKELLLRKALIDVRSLDDESYHFTVGLEIAKIFDILLGYVINLDQDINPLWKDYQFYDILYLSGIVDYILQFAGPDYAVCEQMMNSTLNFDNIKKLINEFKLASPDEINKLTQAFQDFKVNTDISILKAYGDILSTNDPLLAQVKDIVESGAYTAVKDAK